MRTSSLSRLFSRKRGKISSPLSGLLLSRKKGKIPSPLSIWLAPKTSKALSVYLSLALMHVGTSLSPNMAYPRSPRDADLCRRATKRPQSALLAPPPHPICSRTRRGGRTVRSWLAGKAAVLVSALPMAQCPCV